MLSTHAGAYLMFGQEHPTREQILARPNDVLNDPEVNLDGNSESMTADEFLAWRKQQNSKAFDKLDKNKDGVISREEYWAPEKEKADDVIGEEMSEGETPMQASDFADYYKTTDPVYAKEVNKTWRERNPALDQLSIRQTLLQDGKGGLSVNTPARLGFTWDNVSNDSFYTLDGAISYNFEIVDDRFYISPTVEAHISNQAINERDSVTYALPATWNSKLYGDHWIKRHYLKGIGSFNTDRENLTETIDASLLYTADIPQLAIGATAGKYSYPVFVMRPWIGLDYGSVRQDGGVQELAAESEYLRLRGDLEATLWLADHFSLAGRYVHYTFLNGLERSFNYAELSAILYLDNAKAFSMGATYRLGEFAPQFNDVDSFNIWMGIKF